MTGSTRFVVTLCAKSTTARVAIEDATEDTFLTKVTAVGNHVISLHVAVSGLGHGARWLQVECEPGHYCTGGVRVPCPPGYFGSSSGLKTPSCSGPCAAGAFHGG